MSELLIDCLKEGLDPALVARLESDKGLKEEAVKYLNDLLVNEQLLSTDLFASTSSAVPGKRTLTEEIAELDLRARQFDIKLAKMTNDNRDLIITVSQDLKAASAKTETRLDAELNAILLNISDMHVSWETPSKARAIEKLAAASNSVLFDFDSVLDILELPALCKLCILHGNYQEALEISMMVKMLVIKFPHLLTFRKLEDRIKAELQIMVKGLVKLLNTNLKQSNILKIFQILNRPDLLNIAAASGTNTPEHSLADATARSHSLKVMYLNSRFKFITTELASLKPLLKLKTVTYLKRCIETYREHLSNSLSIYHAIFNSTGVIQDVKEDHFLTHAFVKSLVRILICELREHYGSIGSTTNEDDSETRGHKDGVVLQLIYLCKSLDKYGLNFESMLTWELCLVEPTLVTQQDWSRNLIKVKKFRS